MKKIIVTGGLGFIGSNLIDLLLKKNFFVINIDKATYSSNQYNVKEFKNSKKYKFIKLDIKNKKLSNIFFKYKPNGIKIDIEGAEIEILESMKPEDWPSSVTHLVFEYTFDVDPSVPRFRKIIENLGQHFSFIHHKKMAADLQEYKFWPPCVNVFCKK